MTAIYILLIGGACFIAGMAYADRELETNEFLEKYIYPVFRRIRNIIKNRRQQKEEAQRWSKYFRSGGTIR